MPQEPQFSHRNIRNTNLPYVSFVNPTATDNCFLPGSQDILTSIAGFAQRRPGFSIVDASGFNNQQRVFTWDRFDGSFYKIYCDITPAGLAAVYKLAVGLDVSPVSIFTDTSSTPFDFVVSNNTLYFSNGNVAKKWDPVNGISNWGIAIGSLNNATGPITCGTGFNGGGVPPWINPNNATSLTNYATVSASGKGKTLLTTESYGFGIAASTIITGIQVTFDANLSGTAAGAMQLTMVKNGVAIGDTRQLAITNGPATYTFGGTSYLWGTTWTPNDINQSIFGVILGALFQGGTGTYNYSVRNVRLKIYGIGGPGVAFSGTGLTAATGYVYVLCYGNSNTGHVSSPTPQSSSLKPANQGIQVTLTASTDPQVNQIRVFRSTDSVAAGGAAEELFEIPTSPFTNTNQNIVDNAVDSALIVQSLAPTPGFNDPPPPMQSLSYYAGRIWGFANNKLYFSALEECINGVPEESFVSGIAGNFYNFDEPLQGTDVAGSADNQTLAVFSGGRVYGIVGTTLDTFRRATISKRRGTRNLTCITALGSMVAWLDSASQVWSTDGTQMKEIGIDIRPDLANLNPATCSMTFHVANTHHWLVLSTGTQVLVYDLDTEQWMPPWSIALQYVYSGEVSAGNYQLFGCTANTTLILSDLAHNDNGATYQPIVKTNLMSLVPDFGTRFSYAATGIYDEPSRTGSPWYFVPCTNAAPISDVLLLVDDDPTNAQSLYKSIFSQQTTVEAAFQRKTGTNLVELPFAMTQPAGRRISWMIKAANADDNWKLFGYYMAYKSVGGK